MQKTVWLLWLQGWNNAPWLQKKVFETWKFNNPTWNVVALEWNNLSQYFCKDELPYLYDETKSITHQTMSDIIRLSLLDKYGGVWADATMLCLKPLDEWVDEKIHKHGFWMYHGDGAGYLPKKGPAGWFIISEPNNYIISHWRKSMHDFWLSHDSNANYFLIDELFCNLYKENQRFCEMWDDVPYIYCEDFGQAHTMVLSNCHMEENNENFKKMIKENPPYALKMWKHWNDMFPTDVERNGEACQNSNGFFAIQVALRLSQ